MILLWDIKISLRIQLKSIKVGVLLVGRWVDEFSELS